MSDIRTAPPTGRAILEVWEKGLSCIRPFKPAGGADTSAIETEWNFGPCFPPSYQAFGRMRALLAAIQTSQMAGHRVLEVAAGDGSLATGLAAQGREVYA